MGRDGRQRNSGTVGMQEPLNSAIPLIQTTTARASHPFVGDDGQVAFGVVGRLAVRLEAEGVLNFGGELGVGNGVVESARGVLDPALVENEEQIVSGLENPAEAALPAEVARIRIELNEIREGDERRQGIVDARG